MIGTKWYKCDLHLHTPASKCFHDATVTPEQWVKEAIDKGLDFVAVTDHNSAEWVELIQAESLIKGLNVFPGVELTCSEAKVHILVLFEIGTNRRAIEDFLTICRIDSSKFGEQDAHSPLTIEQVLQEAKLKNAICIPAHIDEYSGFEKVAHGTREILFQNDGFLGVQVVHKEFLIDDSKYKKQEALISVNKFRGVTDDDIAAGKLKITEEKLKEWRNPVTQALKYGKSILTFSDNPHSEYNPKHGLWGMGKRFTWIKMDQKPSLESLRQALLLHQFRIKNDFDCPGQPYKTPDTWIEKIIIKGTEISKTGEIVEIDFSSQMNTIIGSRGSGKSAILQFLRGALKKDSELINLESIDKEFKKFFQVKTSAKQGVLKPGCTIEVIFNRRNELFKVIYTQINGKTNKWEIFKLNTTTGLYDDEQDLSFLEILDIDIFSQKEIYEIANNINSLRDKIDEMSPAILDQKNILELKKTEYVKLSSGVTSLKNSIIKKSVLKAEILDLENKIKKFDEIGIESELKNIQNLISDNVQFRNFEQNNTPLRPKFDELIDAIRGVKLNSELFSDETRPILNLLIEKINLDIETVALNVEASKNDFNQLVITLNTEIESSPWIKYKSEIEQSLKIKKQTLTDEGVDDIEAIESDINLLAEKKATLENYKKIEEEILKNEGTLSDIKIQYVTERRKLTEKRQEFLADLLKYGKVRAKVLPYKDFDNLEEQIRHELNSQDTFEKDIEIILELWSGPDPQRSNRGVFNKISEIHSGISAGEEFEKRFSSKLKTLNGEQLDNFDLMFPEDLIQLEYNTTQNTWKPISNASAGQKTVAILTLIMSEGTKPLILDQPEDDLDNHLIYELVVDQLRKSKETRQIITATHNANIPVNGDSEVIIVMDSESKYLNKKLIGTIEEQNIKNAVCLIMEGGTAAFNMRSKRYKNVI